MEKEHSLWETESGLIDDVDAWIANAYFGTKEEYTQSVIDSSGGAQQGLMLIFDLVDENGEILASQGYSIGKGWVVSDDGTSISHPKRKNVVKTTVYGQLQDEVVKKLEVDMEEYGAPTEAASWIGLGFHWMLREHDTLTPGKKSSALMPSQFLGKKGEGEAATAEKPVAKAAAKPASAAETKALELVKESASYTEFSLKVIKVPEIVGNEKLMATCLDNSEKGFFATNKGK